MKKTKIRVTKKFTFDMAHALYGHDGPCRNIHGHTYHLYVTLLGEPVSDEKDPKLGMVIDFSDLKRIVKENIVDLFDHALVLNQHSPHSSLRHLQEQFQKIIFVPYQPSCENMLADFVHRIQGLFPKEVTLLQIRLDETPTSFAEWHLSDNL